MHRVITFLGLAAKPTEYDYRGQTYKGGVFAEALRQFVPDFDEMLVFVTPRARAATLPVLQGLGDERIVPVDIPNGETDDEMWETFERVTSAVDHGDAVTFDITHGLRSIPFLVFLAAAFLKSAKGVTIRAIYYGAYDLGQSEDKDKAARPGPVIDLSPFVGLLDWIDASNRFIRLGDAGALADLLRQATPDYQSVRRHDKEADAQAKLINKAANALTDASLALQAIRPDAVMEASERVQDDLGAAAAATHRWARPFTVLAGQVSDAYAPLALPHARAPENRLASLNRERQLVQWYLDRTLFVQAVAVAREWLVTWGIVQTSDQDPYDRGARATMEWTLGEALQQRQGKSKSSNTDVSSAAGAGAPAVDLEAVPAAQRERWLTLYEQIGDIRNTLLHAGKRPNADAPKTLEKKAKALCAQLRDLPLPTRDEAAL